MNTPFLEFFGMNVTAWHVIGYAGVLMFSGRWIAQIIASRAKNRPTVPRVFWYMSMLGSILLLLYFAFGRQDFVGTLSNLFPFFIALYNLILIRKNEHGDEI